MSTAYRVSWIAKTEIRERWFTSLNEAKHVRQQKLELGIRAEDVVIDRINVPRTLRGLIDEVLNIREPTSRARKRHQTKAERDALEAARASSGDTRLLKMICSSCGNIWRAAYTQIAQYGSQPPCPVVDCRGHMKVEPRQMRLVSSR